MAGFLWGEGTELTRTHGKILRLSSPGPSAPQSLQAFRISRASLTPNLILLRQLGFWPAIHVNDWAHLPGYAGDVIFSEPGTLYEAHPRAPVREVAETFAM